MKMATGEGEDPFGSLIKFCQPTSSQELKLQNCSFARESETFPDYFDSLATSSPEPTPLEPVGIVIVSPPETESEDNSSIGKSNTQENENFLTPPEHHNPSASSSQEDPQRLRPISSGDSKVSVSVVAETIADDNGRVENEGSIDMGEREKNLGFSGTEEIDSPSEVLEGQRRDGVNEVGRIKGFRRDLKIFNDFLRKLNEPSPTSKKIRVSEENRDSGMHTLRIDGTRINDRQNDTEIIDLDTEEIDEGKIIIDVDKDLEKNGEVREHGEPWENAQEVSDTAAESVEGVEKSEKCGSGGNIDLREKEKGVDLDRGDKFLNVNGNLILNESEEGVRDNTNNEVLRDGKAVSNGSSVRILWKFRCGSPGNGVDGSVKERVARGRHELPSTVGKNDRGEKESIGNTEEVQKSKNSGSGDIEEREKQKAVAPKGGGKRKKVNGTLTVAESEGRIRDNSNNKVHRDGKAVSCSSSVEKIEKFRYALRSSIEEKDVGEKESIGNTEEVQKSKNSDSGDIDEREKEKSVPPNGGGKRLKVNGTLALAESEGRIRDSSNTKVHRDGKAVLGSSSIEKIEKFKYELPLSTEEKDMGEKESIGNTEKLQKSKNSGSDSDKVQKSKNSGSDSDIDEREKEKGVTPSGGGKRLKVNGTLAESGETVRDSSNNKVHRDGKKVLGSRSTKKIENFRYEGHGVGADDSAKGRFARGRRELPLSIRGTEKDMGGEENRGYIKVKNGSWKDLVDALEVLFRKVDDGCEDVDFLETAKSRGLTFPQPRWI